MSQIERQIERLTNSTNKLFPNIGNWFIDIGNCKLRFSFEAICTLYGHQSPPTERELNGDSLDLV
jgi:hypothetical protein